MEHSGMSDHPYPRERTWPDCEAELERLRRDIEALTKGQLVHMAIIEKLETKLKEQLMSKNTEIQRLRSLLSEALPYFGLQTVAPGQQAPHPLGVRIRKVLGDD